MDTLVLLPGTSFQFLPGGGKIFTDYRFPKGGQNRKKKNVVCKNTKIHYFFKFKGGECPPAIPPPAPQMTSLLIDNRQTAGTRAAICRRIILLEQFVIGRRRHLLVGYRLHYRLHIKLNMTDLATATFYSLVSFLVLLSFLWVGVIVLI